MANPRVLDKRRKSIRNIKKITRTMELIATARFKRAMDRATAASDYTRRIAGVVSDLANAGLEVSHPLLNQRETTNRARMLVLTANRGLCGGYNGNVIRLAVAQRKLLTELTSNEVILDVAGKRGETGFKFRNVPTTNRYLQFDDRPAYDDVEQIANEYLLQYEAGEIDRLDVVYTQFVTSARQVAVYETLLPLGSLGGGSPTSSPSLAKLEGKQTLIYQFIPSAESILEEIVPMSFKVKLFKCFLDAAVSEQIARMVAMKNATESANEMIGMLSRTYNRARQSQITNQIMEIIGGVEAMDG
ncbi:MAG TPA: ATP synthase F1 subunit gamma [Pirellulaceae bacterium]|nr:ATP synthase F1 subunit gamma [Pirellulaceae bacterium]HMO91283.1 ATP synthase F1 subunit gamma [Pirellulaceae bacterium]HMP68533.1 ATP synthase F1 subunit gamma [Pirellulaceae bacterium]